MSITVKIADDQRVRVAGDAVETRPPNQFTFGVEGVLSMTEQLIGQFEGATLRPSRMTLSVDDDRTVEIDLADEASLRLSSVDVGVETPDSDDIPEGVETLTSSVTDPSALTDANPAALAFTVEGSVLDVPEETIEILESGDVTLESLSFAVDDGVRTDGGSPDDVVFEVTLLGYGITVRRDGTIVVGVRDDLAGLDLG